MHAAIIYPHQLFLPESHPALKRPIQTVYLVEEPLLFTHNPIHRQRLLLHKLSLDSYQQKLIKKNYQVIRVTIQQLSCSTDLFEILKRNGVTVAHIVDTTDDYLEQAITLGATGHAINLQRYESPLFLLAKTDAMERYQRSKRSLANFYKELRKDTKILLTDNNEPLGGKWSFDADNRKKLPRQITLPDDLTSRQNLDIKEAIIWLSTVPSEQYGETNMWLPYTHGDAEEFLQRFLQDRFSWFGTYEDALTTHHTRLFHSTLSPLMNIGLLTPEHVLNEALAYGHTHNVPLNSLEGFVRQILGWREFIRASYEVDGKTMRKQNFFQHTQSLPTGLWDATTGIDPVDHVIKTALRFGYTHHIERLMVMGNFLLLTQTHPDEVYRWFMALYVDAYDWVMVPNVYGMSQYADGGSFTTKPYISGASYLKKMSDYPAGEWEGLWTALYWNFIHEHEEFFAKNHRLRMMPRLFAKFSSTQQQEHLLRAHTYLKQAR